MRSNAARCCAARIAASPSCAGLLRSVKAGASRSSIARSSPITNPPSAKRGPCPNHPTTWGDGASPNPVVRPPPARVVPLMTFAIVR